MYYHLDKLNLNAEKKEIKADKLILYSGDSVGPGQESVPPHLHYEVRLLDSASNPTDDERENSKKARHVNPEDYMWPDQK